MLEISPFIALIYNRLKSQCYLLIKEIPAPNITFSLPDAVFGAAKLINTAEVPPILYVALFILSLCQSYVTLVELYFTINNYN
jgi:hypothetical protein